MKKILLFNVNPIVKQILCIFNIEVIDVNRDDYNQQLGYLLKLDGFNRNNNSNNYFTDSMMVFFNLSDDDLDNILNILKVNQIKVDLKAIVTEHNINWLASYLHEHLTLEKQEILKMKSSN